ncbi:MAG: hypothetical protein NUV54_03125 [Candidatus Taylorbacteria bacterium]|nr:hypothetical protein [Candidatus Taylorbacteria bacterium]
MHEDVKWLFGLIIVFGLTWYIAGGFNNDTAKNPFIKPFSTGGEAETYGNDVIHIGSSNGIGDSPTITNSVIPANTKPINQDELVKSLENSGLQEDQIQKEIATLGQAGGTSPLSGKLSISTVHRGSQAIDEYIIVKANKVNTEKVLLTGLRLESSASGRGSAIPKGVHLPFQNQINVEELIYLLPGETAYIITGRSPLGSSFQLNRCTGFYTQYQTFSPQLPSRCPSPSSEPLTPPLNQYNDLCLDYISSLSSCRIVTKFPANISPECQRYITTEINYTKCVDHHKNEAGFYDPEWRVYLNRDDILWKSKRELIHLIDSNNRVIDAVTY